MSQTGDMTVKIGMIEDRGISKKLHFSKLGSNEVSGYVMVNEHHPWFNKQVDDDLLISG